MSAAPAVVAGSLDPLEAVASYYAAKVAMYGPTPLGVDWSCQPTQQLRFVQLLKLCDFTQPLSINDLGCGYGALRQFMHTRWPGARIDYHGVDLVPDMVAHARRAWRERDDVAFTTGNSCARVADFSVASGIFNVKLDGSRTEWVQRVRDTLIDMNRCSTHGFAVNFLASDPGLAPVPELYRTASAPWRQFCESTFGVKTEILDRYGMREFTLLARK